jgi:hypothetical protein
MVAKPDTYTPTMDLSRPIFSAPPGYRIDLANPQRSGVAANIWVGTVGMCIAVVFMGIRIYTKIVLARDFASDDGMLHFQDFLGKLSNVQVFFEISDNHCRSSSNCLGAPNLTETVLVTLRWLTLSIAAIFYRCTGMYSL